MRRRAREYGQTPCCGIREATCGMRVRVREWGYAAPRNGAR